MWILVLAVLFLAPVVAHADEGAKVASSVRAPRKHLIYVEALGKGGAYGIGYELTIAPWLAIGGAVSFSMIRDQQVITVAPYLHVTLLRRGAHAMYSELGAILAHSRIPSPVPDWDGMTKTGSGGFLSLGYEHASRHLVLRGSLSIVAGAGGVAPMAGLSIGFAP